MTQANVMFPVGRMIGGNLYKPFPETDNFGKPKKNADGTPVESFSFGVAIKKGAEKHWSETTWGKEVVAVGFASHPQQANLPSYAWKIKDGDSTVPNRVGKLPSSMEGCAGCWLIWFKQKWAPQLVAEKGTVKLMEPDAIVPGYYVEVYASVAGNTGPTPGVYMNPIAVNRVAFGERIATTAVDTTSVGFGQSALPAGASATPLGGGFVPPAQPQQAVNQFPAAMAQQGMVNMAPNGTGLPVQGAAAQMTPAVAILPPPNPAFLAVPPPAQHVMTAAAKGATYEAMLAAGWTHQLMVQHGMVVA